MRARVRDGGALRLDRLGAATMRADAPVPPGRPGASSAPAQDRIPLLPAATRKRTLRLAARYADTVGFTGATQDDDGNLGVLGRTPTPSPSAWPSSSTRRAIAHRSSS